MSSSKSCFSPTNNSKATNKHVLFEQVEIREFPMILGDNPSTADGIPLTIDWHPQHHDMVGVDNFESHRGNRRHQNQLLLSPSKRTDIACHAGATQEDIGHATPSTTELRRRRENLAEQDYLGHSILIDGFQRPESDDEPFLSE